MAEIVPEAYEPVEHGLLTDDDFRDFMFANAVRFWPRRPGRLQGHRRPAPAAEIMAA